MIALYHVVVSSSSGVKAFKFAIKTPSTVHTHLFTGFLFKLRIKSQHGVEGKESDPPYHLPFAIFNGTEFALINCQIWY
jgi:hypothetical protein